MNNVNDETLNGDSGEGWPRRPGTRRPPAAESPCSLSRASDYLEQLWRLVDGDLSEVEEERLCRHTDGCPYCTTRLAGMAAANVAAEEESILRSPEEVWPVAVPVPIATWRTERRSSLGPLSRILVSIRDGIVEILENPGRLVPLPDIATRGDEEAEPKPAPTIELSSLGLICRIRLTSTDGSTCTASVHFDLPAHTRTEGLSVLLVGPGNAELESQTWQPEGVVFRSLEAGTYDIILCRANRDLAQYQLQIQA